MSFEGVWEEEVEIADGEEDVGEEVVEEDDIDYLSEQKPRVIFHRKVLKIDISVDYLSKNGARALTSKA